MSSITTTETIVSEDGTPIAVWRSGEGPPLVLVHGAIADHGRWAPVLPSPSWPWIVVAAAGAATRRPTRSPARSV